MTLFKLSVSNIRKSVRDYAIYFFTLTIGVSVFYVFNAIGSQAAMMEVTRSRNDIVELLSTMLSGVSVFVAGVLGLLIVYASRFLMKRRNKEFALYLLLGMGKGKISAILLIETVIISICSLGAGLVIGIGLSQLMSALVANLFEADMTAYRFSISSDAIIKTIFYFAVMYLVMMIFNSAVISRFKLIDLLQSGKRSERIKLKKPLLCILTFIIAVSSLAYAYYNVGWRYEGLTSKKMVLYIAMGIVSTFLIFWSVTGSMLRIVMSMKKTYYRGLNAFTFRQISSKVNTVVFSMTVICLMLFVTICTLAAAFSIRNSMNANLNLLCPADFEFEYREYSEEEDAFVAADIEELCSEYGYDITEDFSEYVHFHSYVDKDFTFAVCLGDRRDEFMERFPFLLDDEPFDLFRLSDYNALMELYGREPLTMEDSEYIVLCDFKSSKEIMDEVLTKGQEITICGKKLKSRYDECQDGFIELSAQHINTGLYIVPDSVVDESYANVDLFIGNYRAEGREEKLEAHDRIVARVEDILAAQKKDNPALEHQSGCSTRIAIEESSIGLGAIITFIGLYIGLVFLIACGAILALKELSESVDSIGRYEMLRKIGADESELSRSLFRQTGIFFLLPLLLAAVHSVFGMKFAMFFLQVFGTEKIGESVAATSIILLLIYGGYFLITYFCSKGIISKRADR